MKSPREDREKACKEPACNTLFPLAKKLIPSKSLVLVQINWRKYTIIVRVCETSSVSA
jgi:hypothetical protein